MSKKLLIFTMSLLLGAAVNAQAPHRDCGTTDHDKWLKTIDPQYEINRTNIEQFTQEYVANHMNDNSRSVVNIPVVVHVVYQNATENISDAMILSQIEVLNDDYRRLNSDVGETPAYFTGVAADCEINFCLASKDPNGAATTGIRRVSTTKTSFTTDDKVKYTAQGGDDAWDRNSYLNLWVCDLGASLLGYAQFPGGAAATDGVVCHYKYFGVGGAGAAPYDLGRTATHEVGHWLNLYHIWGDDGTGCGGSDLVADTPNQADETYGCPNGTIRISCSNGPNGDMYENYMDYTDDGCMNIFTAGQKARMQALFAAGGARVSILSSTGCGGGGVSCGTPSGLASASVTSSSATISWTTVVGATSYNVRYRVLGGATWTNTTSATTSKALTGLTAGTTYEYQIQTVCSGGALSAFSGSATFLTTGGVATCTDIQEPNSTSATAGTLTAGTTYHALISTSTDVDWYKFTTSGSNTKIKITLSSLPGDYDMRLYNQSLTQKGISENAGTTDEQIIWNTTTTGTRYIKVYGYGGAYSAGDCYDLLVQTSTSNFRTTEGASLEEVYDNSIETLYPNPADDILNIDYFSIQNVNVQVKVYDIVGKLIQTTNTTVAEGENIIKLNTSEISGGFYILEISNGKSRYTTKFLKN